ncbi:MAG: energy transducer TonB [Proteobacteria bacterium]|nr:energy transducer TonB [Pseudomonadota bacterium]
MRKQIVRFLLAIGTGLSCLVVANVASAAISEARLIGMAMHHETGRNIYIGALHYDELVPRPDDLMAATGPMAMEYRVVARRTSIRSLMGNVLLQGELATGHPPGASTIEFAGDIMANVKGSLYAGDSLEIRINKDASIVALLGGLELARTKAREVADYFLIGWVGEGGPSTAFRNSILSTEIDRSLMSIYSAHTVSDERLATISAWSEPGDAEAPVAVTVVSAPVAMASAPIEGLVLPAESKTKLNSADTDTIAGSSVQTGGVEPVLLASLSPSREMMLPEAEDQTAEEAIDAMEYSQRLAEFNTLVLRKVYSHIRYPRAAVRRNIQGTLELDLMVDSEGGVLDITVARSSGHSMLDKSALKAAREAFKEAPLKDIDQVAVAEYSEDGNQLIIPIPISFVLTE